MRVALYQCRPLPLDVAGNLQRLREIAQQAEGIDLLVLPEMFLTGYNIGAQAVAGHGVLLGHARGQVTCIVFSDTHARGPIL